MNSRHFLLSCNPFWWSSDFLNAIGPSRSVCSGETHLRTFSLVSSQFHKRNFFVRGIDDVLIPLRSRTLERWLVTWHIRLKCPPWIFRRPADQSKSRIQNPVLWLVGQTQTQGVNFKLTSLLPCKDLKKTFIRQIVL